MLKLVDMKKAKYKTDFTMPEKKRHYFFIALCRASI